MNIEQPADARIRNTFDARMRALGLSASEINAAALVPLPDKPALRERMIDLADTARSIEADARRLLAGLTSAETDVTARRTCPRSKRELGP